VDYSASVIRYERYLLTGAHATVSGLDLTLFMRPFTKHSWTAILILSIFTAFSLLLVPYLNRLFPFLSSKENLTSTRIAVISIWLFFVLVNAYYGGALTMFFSTPPDPPFTTIEEGLESPDWDLILQTGSGMKIEIEVLLCVRPLTLHYLYKFN